LEVVATGAADTTPVLLEVFDTRLTTLHRSGGGERRLPSQRAVDEPSRNEKGNL